MEAAKLQKKKTSISKGKLKKTIKNVICRPDPVFWPVVSDEQAKQLDEALTKLKILIPDFQKPLWSVLKSIPKEKRPKPQKLEKVDGLLFGITTCVKAINCRKCAGVILDSDINPKILVQHVIDACNLSEVPVLCLNSLKKICSDNFGVATSCLGLETDSELISDLRNKVLFISKEYCNKNLRLKNEIKEEQMDIDNESSNEKEEAVTAPFNYLYRKTKTSRVFTPPSTKISEKPSKAFFGQDFIKFSGNTEEKQKNSKAFMSMIVKKITNNANRIKKD